MSAWAVSLFEGQRAQDGPVLPNPQRTYWFLLVLISVQSSGCPCFKGGARSIQNLRKRFALTFTEQVQYILIPRACVGGSAFLISELVLVVVKAFVHVFTRAATKLTRFRSCLQQCVSLVLNLISSSLDAWRTRQYDYYQRLLNGIL